MAERSVADGRLEIPPHWPRWMLKCQAHSRRTKKPCGSWAVMGMPTCRLHGSGGERNKEIGQIRYLSWIIVGGPQTGVPAEAFARVALATAFDQLIRQGRGSIDQQLRAALWLTERIDR